MRVMPTTKSDSLWVRQLPLGQKKNFVSLVGAPDSELTAVVDPAWDAAAVENELATNQRSLAAILLTHHHDDHVNAVGELLTRHDVPVYAQVTELPWLSAFKGAVRGVQPGEVVQVGSLPITCLHTPGHTPGSQCLWCGGALFSGDTLFVNACGRCDLPGGDAGQMFDSLHRVLAPLEDATVLYPGHDYGDVPVSSLGRERARNPYFSLKELGAFVEYRLRPRVT